MFVVFFPTPSLLLSKEAIMAMQCGMNYTSSNEKSYPDVASSVSPLLDGPVQSENLKGPAKKRDKVGPGLMKGYLGRALA